MDCDNRLELIDNTIVIRKLSTKTRVQDCRKSLWHYINMSREDIGDFHDKHGRYMLLEDIPSPVWMAMLGRNGHYVYGHSLNDVMGKLLINYRASTTP